VVGRGRWFVLADAIPPDCDAAAVAIGAASRHSVTRRAWAGGGFGLVRAAVACPGDGLQPLLVDVLAAVLAQAEGAGVDARQRQADFLQPVPRMFRFHPPTPSQETAPKCTDEGTAKDSAPNIATPRPRTGTVPRLAVRVRIVGVNHLVHELWISNPGPAAVTLSEVSVSSGSRTLAQYQGAELTTHVGRPGLPRSHSAPPGARAGGGGRRVLLAAPRSKCFDAVAR
jgi:hypothetical protein